eukprot:TRINITY_DN5901_c0_g1_i1.p1 TRINITY_DN5901_c0_g1~~TRINITY_DN5901_c0_g1_i1.p1  ORF type:complete len:205 (+),score=79.57 TRINITY_DN5901_c0_g1_i1:75-617(+)
MGGAFSRKRACTPVLTGEGCNEARVRVVRAMLGGREAQKFGMGGGGDDDSMSKGDVWVGGKYLLVLDVPHACHDMFVEHFYELSVQAMVLLLEADSEQKISAAQAALDRFTGMEQFSSRVPLLVVVCGADAVGAPSREVLVGRLGLLNFISRRWKVCDEGELQRGLEWLASEAAVDVHDI